MPKDDAEQWAKAEDADIPQQGADQAGDGIAACPGRHWPLIVVGRRLAIRLIGRLLKGLIRLLLWLLWRIGRNLVLPSIAIGSSLRWRRVERWRRWRRVWRCFGV